MGCILPTPTGPVVDPRRGPEFGATVARFAFWGAWPTVTVGHAPQKLNGDFAEIAAAPMPTGFARRHQR